jgi:hypothetical protein
MLINVTGDQHTQPHIRKSSEYAMISLCVQNQDFCLKPQYAGTFLNIPKHAHRIHGKKYKKHIILNFTTEPQNQSFLYFSLI